MLVLLYKLLDTDRIDWMFSCLLLYYIIVFCFYVSLCFLLSSLNAGRYNTRCQNPSESLAPTDIFRARGQHMTVMHMCDCATRVRRTQPSSF